MIYNIHKEKGVTMIALVITIMILLIVTNMFIYNAKDSIHIKALNNLYNDIDVLREKISEYYNEYGKIPAKIKYDENELNQLSNILSTKNDIGDFYVIDLEAMKGITLNYGKDYEKIKNDKDNVNNYKDIYIINENSHNIFYVKGIKIEENSKIKTYYTDYTEPDNTIIDLRYIDGILIPQGYYYIGKSEEGNIVISKNKGEEINNTNENQYIWQKDLSYIDKVPSTIILSENQNEEEFFKSVNYYKGYFKNISKTEKVDIIYLTIEEDKWSEFYTKETEYIDQNGDIAYIPENFCVSMSPIMNTVDKGLVIKDKKENEFVWIEVPKKITENCTNDEEIEKELSEYAKIYEGSNTQEYNFKDEWYDGNGKSSNTTSNSNDTSGCGLTYKQYNEAKSKMLQSIKSKGGFWISRYEIGNSNGITVSKADQKPYNNMTCSQAEILARQMFKGENITSNILFGIQWDLVCKFLEVKENWDTAEGKERSYYINSDSTDWGNYLNKSLKITSKNAMQYNSSTWSSIIGLKPKSGILLTTGASEEAKKMNIYDFAGNAREFTLQYATYTDGVPCVSRGGSEGNNGFEYPASSYGFDRINTKNEIISFRVTFY